MALVGSLVVSLQASTQAFMQGMRQASTAVQQLAGQVVSAQASISGFEAAIAGMFTAHAVIVKVTQALGELVQAAARMESIKITMTNVFGGSEAAANALAKTRGLADQLGLSTEDLAKGFTNLTAASKGTAIEGATTEKVFQQLVAITRALGKSSSDTAQILLASQQILTKGTIMAEEFRGQLGERLPGILQAGARAMNTSLEGFAKMMERGELGARHFATIVDEMFRNVGLNAAAAADTFESHMNRLGNAWTKLGETLMSGALGRFLKDTLTILTMSLEGWERIVAAAWNLRGPARMLPSPERQQFVTQGFVDENSPEFQKLELLRTKMGIVGREINRLDQNMQELGATSRDIDRMAALEAKLGEVSKQYQEQRERVIKLNEIGKQYRENLDAAAKAEDERRRKVEQLTNALSQASTKIKEVSEHQRDLNGRLALQPELKEFFSRDFLADTKKNFDQLTTQLAKITKQVEDAPTITFAQVRGLNELQQAVALLTQQRQEATQFLRVIDELEATMRRVGQVREETARMTLGEDEAKRTAAERKRQLDEETEAIKRRAGSSVEAARQEAQALMDAADAARFKVEAERVGLDIARMRELQFTTIRDALEKERRQLLETRQAWLEYNIAKSALPPDEEADLRARARRNQETRDFIEDLNETMQRVLQIRDETAKLTTGPDEAQLTAADRRRQIEREKEQIKELALVNEDAARMRIRALLEMADAERDAAEGVRVGLEVDKLREKEFQRIADALEAERVQLTRHAESAIDLAITMAHLSRGQELDLQARVARNREIRDTLELNQREGERAQELATLLENLREETEALTLAERDRLNLNLNRLQAKPIERQDVLERFDEREAAFAAKTIDDIRKQQRASVDQLIKGQNDQIQAYTMTRREILEYTLALNNADEAQQRMARSNLDMLEQLEGARAMADFVIDAFADLAFRGEMNFQKLAQSFTQMVFRIGIQALELDKHLAKLFAKGIELGLSLLGGSAGVSSTAAGGTGFPGATAPLGNVSTTTAIGGTATFQHGGRFWGGQPMTVGEAGPELILPSVPGVVLTGPQTQAMMGGAPPNVTFNIYALDTPNVIQSRGAISRALLSALREAQRTL